MPLLELIIPSVYVPPAFNTDDGLPGAGDVDVRQKALAQGSLGDRAG